MATRSSKRAKIASEAQENELDTTKEEIKSTKCKRGKKICTK